MSLRSELHAAYDELSPEDTGVSERVVMTVLRDRPRRAAWSFRLRAPLSLVAVLVVIAVVAGALMGGRLLADWRAFIAPPQPAAPQTPLQKLESRPLHMQRQSATDHCADGPYNKDGNIGTSPMHVSGSSVVAQTSWGFYYYDFLYADGPVKGPLLLRGRDLVTFQARVFVGRYAAGPVAGNDVLDGQVVEQHVELVITDPAPPYAWEFTAGAQNTHGCEEWQIDGPDFTETFTFRR